MPLPLYLARSSLVRLERRMRSSLPTASVLHRSWNPHSGQSRLTTVSGGKGADSRDATWDTFLCTARDNAAAFTESVACFSPCSIFAVPVFAPKAFASEIASNAAMVLSEADSLLFATKRIGTNRDGTPSAGSAGSARHRPPLLGLVRFRQRRTANTRISTDRVPETRCTSSSLGRPASGCPHAGRIPPSRRPMLSIRCPLGVLPWTGDGI